MATSLDWYGCATFALRTAGLTVFLDAYIDRAPNAAGTGLTADDVDQCDWIVVGHSHFDHLYGAERIARNTGARIVGSYETVRIMEQAGVPLDRMICVAGGETIALSDGVRVSAFPSQHSCVWSQGQMTQADEVCVGDLGLTWQEQRARFEELLEHLAGLEPSSRDPSSARSRATVATVAHWSTCSTRPTAASSTRTRPGTGQPSCATSDPT
jgi:Beta-lactamase superfamily domain